MKSTASEPGLKLKIRDIAYLSQRGIQILGTLRLATTGLPTVAREAFGTGTRQRVLP